MSRIWKYAKVDLLSVKMQKWFILFPMVALILIVRQTEPGQALFAVTYTLFGGIILCTMPFTVNAGGQKGFIEMLPGTDRQRILGHFLFGLAVLTLLFCFEFALAGILSIWQPGIFGDTWSVYLIVFGVALLFAGVQMLVLVLFPSNSLLVAQLLRLVPGFLFFFGITALQDQIPGIVSGVLAFLRGIGGIGFLILCLILYLGLGMLTASLAKTK